MAQEKGLKTSLSPYEQARENVYKTLLGRLEKTPESLRRKVLNALETRPSQGLSAVSPEPQKQTPDERLTETSFESSKRAHGFDPRERQKQQGVGTTSQGLSAVSPEPQKQTPDERLTETSFESSKRAHGFDPRERQKQQGVGTTSQGLSASPNPEQNDLGQNTSPRQREEREPIRVGSAVLPSDTTDLIYEAYDTFTELDAGPIMLGEGGENISDRDRRLRRLRQQFAQGASLEDVKNGEISGKISGAFYSEGYKMKREDDVEYLLRPDGSVIGRKSEFDAKVANGTLGVGPGDFGENFREETFAIYSKNDIEFVDPVKEEEERLRKVEEGFLDDAIAEIESREYESDIDDVITNLANQAERTKADRIRSTMMQAARMGLPPAAAAALTNQAAIEIEQGMQGQVAQLRYTDAMNKLAFNLDKSKALEQHHLQRARLANDDRVREFHKEQALSAQNASIRAQQDMIQLQRYYESKDAPSFLETVGSGLIKIGTTAVGALGGSVGSAVGGTLGTAISDAAFGKAATDRGLTTQLGQPLTRVDRY